MALAMRGFTLGVPKPSSIQIPSCKYYQRKAMMTMLQTQNQGLKHAGKISRSIITCAKKKPIGTGSGPKINQTTSSEQLSASNAGSSNSESTGKKSKGEANATPTKSK